MSIDIDGEFSQELKFGQAVTSTEPFSGLKMRKFYPAGAQVRRQEGLEMIR